MELVKDIYKDEIRSGFLVTTNRKKVWNVELEILVEFDRICKKYGLRYFADSGTLLGAVRHKGFIPWDDDIDIMMPRPDYEQFKKVASKEIKPPYFFQNSYTDLVTTAYSKIRDIRTTAIEYLDMPLQYNQGIFIDIIALDAVADGSERMGRIAAAQLELWLCCVDPNLVRKRLENNACFRIGASILLNILKKPAHEKMQIFEDFNLNHFQDSQDVGFITSFFCKISPGRNRELYRDIIEVPFETITIPIPIGYDGILKKMYGDYHQYVRGGSLHDGIILSADIPYKTYIEEIKKNK